MTHPNMHYILRTQDHVAFDGPATGKLATDDSLALFGRFGSLMGLLNWAALFDFLNVRDRWRCGHLFSVVFGTFDVVIWSIRGSLVF